MLIEQKAKAAAKDATKTLKQLQITDSVKKLATTQTNVSKGTATTAAAEAGAEGAATLAAANVSVRTTTTGAAGLAMNKAAMRAIGQLQQASASLTTTERLKKANEQISNDTIYEYCGDYGQFGDMQPCTTGPYSKDIYTNSSAFLSYDTAHAEDRRLKHLIINGMKAFNTFFEKSEVFSIRQPSATLLVITASISKLLSSPPSMDIIEVQKMVKLVYRFANTTLERFTSHWNYQSATLIVCPGTKL